MSLLPLVTALIVYRILVIVLGFLVALHGMSKFRSSRARTGEIEGEYKAAKVRFKNVSAAVLYIFLGSVGVVAGLWKSPVVTSEERDKEGNVRIIKIEHLPPEDVSVADLLNNSEQYAGKMVRVKGKVVEWFMKGGGGEEYMIFGLADGDSKIRVYSSKVEYFSREEHEEVIVTGKYIEDEKWIDASPGVDGEIKRTKHGEKK